MTTPIHPTPDHPFLRSMVPEHRSVITQGAEEKNFSAGEILFREGQPANRLFLIHQGQVALETHVPGRGDILIAMLGPDQVLGWSWLVPPFVWNFQARAVEASRATVLDGGHLLVACERNNYLGYELMKGISKVILNALLIVYQRWLETGHRPILKVVDKPASSSAPNPQTLPIETRMATHPFFHGIPAAHLQALAELARPMEFEPDQVLFRAGEIATGLYVVDHGRIILEAPFSGSSVPVQLIRDGDALGWSAFCEPYIRHVDARAVQSSCALFLAAADLRERCARDYRLGYEVTKRTTQIMLRRLMATRNHMWEACR